MDRGRRVTIVDAADSASQSAIHADKGAHVTLRCRGAGLDRYILSAHRFLATEEAPPA